MLKNYWKKSVLGKNTGREMYFNYLADSNSVWRLQGHLCGIRQYLLADEPVASLDPVTGRQILGLLKSIHETDDVTILMNSHNLEFSQEFSDRLIGLKDGKVVFDGKTTDLTDSITAQIYNKNDVRIENKRGVAYE